ncbi:hypothetical protein G6L74_09270 [Agrobacterium tumefaciens]|uniref:hypothetical protein n=1 Tax=Agrobacterium tumefaciens TaxID=358 RepID=UPI00157167E8|nr:hypothetical protein [Agrobacterium tumefaciens]
MVQFKNPAVKVLNDCKSALEDVTVAIGGLQDKVLRSGVMRVTNLVNRLGSSSNNNFLNSIRQAISDTELLIALPSFSELESLRISGIPVSTRMNDFLNGLRVLEEYINNQITFASTSLAGDDLPIHAQIFSHSLSTMLSDAISSFSLTPFDTANRQSISDLGYQLDRALEIADQLTIAGNDTAVDVNGNLVGALENIMVMFEPILSSQAMSSVTSLIRNARDDARRMMAHRIESFETDILDVPPEQALAPYQFTISGDRLTLQPQDANPKSGGDAMVRAALNALSRLAEDVGEDLAQSNHPRLFRSFKRLRDALTESSSVVEIGMLCASFEGQVNAASDELSDSLLALLNSFSKGVANYASQFEEWQSFSDNAAEANFTPQDGETYAQVARALANELERRPEVDDRVPEALRQVADWNERASTPKSRLSVGRTVLNIIAVCYSEVFAKPVKLAVKTMGTTVAVGLGAAAGAAVVAIVLNQASIHLAELTKPPEAAWLRPASRVIDAHLRKLENP